MQPLCADTLLPDARRLLPELRSLKDDLHRHPELSFQETRTTALLKARLTSRRPPGKERGRRSPA